MPRQSRLALRRQEPFRIADGRGLAVSLVLMAIVCAFLLAVLSPGSALAAGDPAWNITSASTPTVFPPNDEILKEGYNSATHREFKNEIEVIIRDLGGTPIDGSVKPITITIHVSGVSIAAQQPELLVGSTNQGGPECTQSTGSCTVTYKGTLKPGVTANLRINLDTGSPGTASSTATVTGGEANGVPVEAATIEQQMTIGSTPAPFGIQPSSLVAEFVNAEDGIVTQAGAHPYDLSLYWAFNNKVQRLNFTEDAPSEDVKDIAVELPPGVAGDELALGQCTTSVLGEANCPGSSQVGNIQVTLTGGAEVPSWGMFNVKPDNGHTNELGFSADGIFPVHMPTTVRTDNDYGLTSITPHVPNGLGSISSVEASVWGVPADHSHDNRRVLSGWSTGYYAEGVENGANVSPLPPIPFLTMPSQCGKPLVFRVAVDSYLHPGRLLPDSSPDLSDPNWKVSSVTDPPLTGCNRLQSFSPSLTVAPDTSFADTPSGTTVELNVPQGEGLTSGSTLATSTLQDTTVSLPQGMSINPGQANGLAACQFAEDGVGTTGTPSCPAASKVGTVEISTPLLPDKLEGSVYVLQSNPPHLQLLVGVSGDDVNVKLVGEVNLNPVTGQVTATFSGTPQLPFTHFKLTFSGGAQAALSTPPSCGVYSSLADFTPWSSPETADFRSANAFGLGAGPGGTACASPLPFSPSLVAGATTDQAGGYTDFSLLLSRADGQQRIGGLQFKAPEGLLGMLSTVALCQEPQAAAGTCSAASQIGHTVVGAGAGPDPLYIPEAGQPPAPIYLTGPYKGAPFGLSIVVPVIAGPFNLGTVVVRAAINVDPNTAELTISTDALPTILGGVPADLRQINTVIDRPGFMFNPTSCATKEFSGTAQSAEGTIAPISSHFQVGSCQALKFQPNFKVSTQGKTSKADGASLDARIVYPTGALGANQASSQSNIAAVKVDLPKQLPSRLTTLQKACSAAQFNANPAGCPVASVIGHLKAITPVLPVPVEGPVYFVSHGGEAFPSLVGVLQGDGVRVDLTAATFISHQGITSSTFRSVPDVPISSFEINLPEGKYSALAANGNLCKSKLLMPTSFTAQNGAQIHQSTQLSVTGCSKAKAKAKKVKKKTTNSGHAKGRK
jgi:hypothetical protein